MGAGSARRGPAARFEDLEVWRCAHALVLDVYRLTATFPEAELFGLVSQMRRAAVSVPANIVEGFHRRGAAEKIRFLNIAQGSLQELRYFVALARDLDYTHTPDSEKAVESVARLLAAYLRGIERRIARESSS
jgi:four helix bundle protein